jgi:CheY-like chemotaxis protein
VAEIQEGAERVRKIVHDLRRFTRVADQPDAAVVDLPDALDVAKRMASATIRHAARVSISLGVTPFVRGDEGAVCQIFTNLLANAGQAILDAGLTNREITVVTFSDPAGRAVVEVADTGPGIPASVLPRIFDPFFSTKPTGSGMGLGLAITHHLVTQLGGEIEVDSEVGRGTKVRVVLPAAERPRDELGRTAVARPANRARILIIDDDLAVARSMERLLRRDHDVTIVSDGSTALRCLSEDPSFDIVFCDLMMPGMTGMDVFASVNDSQPAVAARFVFMTGGALSRQAAEFLEHTVNPHVAKPFSPEQIRQLVLDFSRPEKA